jgi:hypothetical protein
MQLSQCIREKQGWVEKLKNSEIKNKWIAEAKEQGKRFFDVASTTNLASKGASDEAIKYVFAELEQHYSRLVDGAVVPSPVDAVYQADGLISKELREELLKGVAVLEHVDEAKKDWHPGSNNQVLDLVHPSLYCFVKGVTRQTDGKPLPWKEFLGAGEVAAVTEKDKKNVQYVRLTIIFINSIILVAV